MTTSKTGKAIADGLREAIEFVKGNTEGARVHHAVDVAAIRAQLGMSQGEFGENFGIPTGTIRNWEQGIRSPDQATQNYLHVIRFNPMAVLAALEKAQAETRRAAEARPVRARTQTGEHEVL